MNRITILFLLVIASVACNTKKPVEKSAHPEWAYNSVIYEMNIRQSTPEGTFNAAISRLDSLKSLGIDIIWLMPIHPVGEKNRKGTLGSYYAIKDYYSINPEFGTMADFDNFLSHAHKIGLKIIIDYVGNHTSPDASWVTEKPKEWYKRDSLGNTVVEFDWYDIAKLNYDCAEVREAMEDVLTYWIDKGVDGFRCDMAMLMPNEFWNKSFAKIREMNPNIFLLAEADQADIHTEATFNASYSWEIHHVLNSIAQGKANVDTLKRILLKYENEYPKEAFKLMFTSNHDENSWAGTEFERMGSAVTTMAALTYLLPKGIPLIYTGQEIGFNRRFQFFEKDSLGDWTPNRYTALYKTLNTLKHNNPALAAGERGGEVKYISCEEPNLLIFTRKAECGNRVLSIFNLSTEPCKISYNSEIAGEYINAICGSKEVLKSNNTLDLKPWEYKILTQN